MIMSKTRPLTGLLAAALFTLAAPALVRAQSFYTGGHGDLGIEYTPGGTEFEPHWHLHEGAVVNGAALPEEEEYAPEDLVAVASATAPTLAGSMNWLGVPEGTIAFRLGSEEFEPELGFGTEELTESDWADSTVTVTLSGWSGPGEIALLSGSAPGFTVFASSFDIASSASGNNSWTMDLGVGHAHPVWYLSGAGAYAVEYTWTGTYVGAGSAPGGTAVRGTGTFAVQATPVPEPGTWGALLGLGLFALVFARARRRRVA